MDNSAKQKIVEKIKDSSNILVTVSRNPSVDELSAALGLTVLLNKMKKHATAVFSGAIPPAITFLDPEKTFEATVDSLRDFIIALDKEKADHLRYKVDGDVVKIFITPYRTTITSDDLEFSQGDYNVELVLGLGVKSQDDLDQALTAHGRILHDATVATLTVGDVTSELGSIDWHEQNASSLSEVLVSLSDGLKGEKALLDEQIATAFLTGIVASTDRFSNNKTSSKVMTVAAQLMSAGANQQLIASKLEEAHEIGPNAPTVTAGRSENSDGTTDLAEGESTKLNAKKPAKKEAETKDDGSLTISHEKAGTLEEVANAVQEENQEAAKKEAEQQLAEQTKGTEGEAAKEAEHNLAEQLASVAPAAAGATPSVADLQKDLAAASADVDEAASTPPPALLSGTVNTTDWKNQPSMGGTLNATTEQAQEDKQRELEADRNHTILTHGGGNTYVGDSSPAFQSPLNAVAQPEYEPATVDPFTQAASPTPTDTAPTAYASPVQPPSETLADIDAQNRAPHEEARAAIDAAFDTAPPAPAFTPFASLPEVEPSVASVAPPPPMTSSPEPTLPAPAPTLPPLPPMPDFSTLPPLPGVPNSQPSGALPPEKLEEVLGAPAAPAPSPQPSDPGQFKIPGQNY